MSCAEIEEENVPGKLNSKYKGCSMIEEASRVIELYTQAKGDKRLCQK